MRSRWLKVARVVISLFFLVSIGILFVDFTGKFAKDLSGPLTWLQFVPSLLSFLSVAALAAAGFAVVLLITALFGRVYCSTVCPLGVLQDVISRIPRKRRKKRRYKFHRPQNILRYSILAATILALTFGSVILINLLDPFSNFGKIVSNLFRPVYMLGNNALAWLLMRFDNYSLAPVEITGFNFLPMVYAGIFLGIVIWLAARRGRLFCNSICPVGGLLSLFSRRSLFRIRLDAEKCNSCGLCAADCKAECIDSKSRTVDMSRCVACFNCLSSCKTNGISYSLPAKEKIVQPVTADRNRRYLIAGLLTGTAALTGISALAQSGESRKTNTSPANGQKKYKAPVPIHREHPISPPGSQSLEHFTETCSACHLCITACPTHVLVPAFGQYGLKGIMQPHMDYHISFCNFECNLCSQVCPTGAILPVELEKKKTIQIGQVNFVKDNCIVITENTDCGACSEHCPTKAVNMEMYTNGRYLPTITQEICVGCGACEHACPTEPKAIYVDGNPVHQQAEKPEVEKIDKKIDYDEDFPF